MRRDIDNTPGPAEIDNLRRACTQILEPARAHFGVPFSPSSGYRSRALNRWIGSHGRSQHILGQAVDFEIPGRTNPAVAAWIENALEFDQLILEFYMPGVPDSGWVHCSVVAEGNRRMALTLDRSGIRSGLVA